MKLFTVAFATATRAIKRVGGDMRIFIINLTHAKNRREFQQQQFEKLGLHYDLITATSIDDINNNTYNKYAQDWQRPLRKTELACYFSHRIIWKKIISLNKPALILEDDALLSKRIPRLLLSLNTLTNTDIVNLETRSRKKFVSRQGQAINNHTYLYQLYQDRTGAAGYVLWPSGARKLLHCETLSGIAITDAHITSCHQLASYQVEPAAIIQLDQCQAYGINLGDIQKISTTSISTKKKDKGNIIFRYRRISSQILLGLRQLNLRFKSTRRYINLCKEDFSYD